VIQVIGEGFYFPGAVGERAKVPGENDRTIGGRIAGALDNHAPAKLAADVGRVVDWPLGSSQPATAGARVPPPATDDWPFLYMPDRAFPRVYAGSLLLLAGIALAGVLVFAPRRAGLRTSDFRLPTLDWHMFLLGAAFMLLETKSIVTFGLLFGSTWRVNSLVFFAILVSVLAAIFVSAKVQVQRPWMLYAVLAAALLVNWALPPERLLLDVPALRYVVAALLAFLPVFLANVVFSRSFRDSDEADIAFASNLLGIMAGGALEYFALLFGYRALLLVALVLYLGAAVAQRSLRHAVIRDV
jgi:hypothetical protein